MPNTNAPHEKEVMIAKMNNRTALMTTIIGSIVTIAGVVTPLVIANNYDKNKAEEAATVTPTPSSTLTPTQEEKQTPTPTQKDGDSKKKK